MLTKRILVFLVWLPLYLIWSFDLFSITDDPELEDPNILVANPLLLNPCKKSKNILTENDMIHIDTDNVDLNELFHWEWLLKPFIPSVSSPKILMKTYDIPVPVGFAKRMNHDSGSEMSEFPTISIQVYEITPENKRLVPKFDRVGFEFVDVAELNSFKDGFISMRDYHSLLWNVENTENKRLLSVLSSDNGYRIWTAIVGDLGARHGLRHLKIVDFQVIKLRQTGTETVPHPGTHPHTDRYEGDPNDLYGFRIWIPLHDIDNLVLGVGDCSALIDRECASTTNDMSNDRRQQCDRGNEFQKVKWYHQPSMRPQDIVFFANLQVPHFAANRGDSYGTQQRSGLIINIKYAENPCSEAVSLAQRFGLF